MSYRILWSEQALRHGGRRVGLLGFARVAGPVLEAAMRRATSRDLARLAALLEQSQPRR